MTASLLRLLQGAGDVAGARPLPIWFITFTDLIGLLLAFFILLFSMSSFDAATWPSRVGERSTPPGVGGSRTGGPPEVDRNSAAAPAPAGREIDYLANLVVQKLAGEPALSEALLARREGSLVVSLPGALLFAASSAVVADRGRAALDALGELLATLPNRIEVAAHVRPSGDGSWEVSVARAMAVADALAEAGYRGEIVRRGFGSSRSSQPLPEAPAARRADFVERIDVIVRDGEGSGA